MSLINRKYYMINNRCGKVCKRQVYVAFAYPLIEDRQDEIDRDKYLIHQLDHIRTKRNISKLRR